jgi:hypothetical protein
VARATESTTGSQRRTSSQAGKVKQECASISSWAKSNKQELSLFFHSFPPIMTERQKKRSSAIMTRRQNRLQRHQQQQQRRRFPPAARPVVVRRTFLTAILEEFSGVFDTSSHSFQQNSTALEEMTVTVGGTTTDETPVPTETGSIHHDHANGTDVGGDEEQAVGGSTRGVIDAAAPSVTTTTTTTTTMTTMASAAVDERGEKAAVRTTAHEVRLAEEDGLFLADEQGQQEQHRRRHQRVTTSLSKRQKIGIALLVVGVLILVVATTAFQKAVSSTTTTTNTNTNATTTTLSPPVIRSARAQFILDYINGITLTGRTIMHPNDTTPEGRAIMWLIEDDKTRNNDDMSIASFEEEVQLVSLRQRYALATLWFQTPNHFDDTFLTTTMTNITTATTWAQWTVHECEWYGVTCRDRNAIIAAHGGIDSLRLESISVRGGIPEDLALLTDLVAIDLTSTALVGTIPPSLGDHLTSLQQLYLRDNRLLTGAIPSSFGALTALTDMHLSDNALSGTIPTSLGDLTAMLTLNLMGNELMGSIPSSLTAMTNLTALMLSDNKITGEVPFCQNEARPSLLMRLMVDCDKVSCPCCTPRCPQGDEDNSRLRQMKQM